MAQPSSCCNTERGGWLVPFPKGILLYPQATLHTFHAAGSESYWTMVFFPPGRNAQDDTEASCLPCVYGSRMPLSENAHKDCDDWNQVQKHGRYPSVSKKAYLEVKGRLL